MSFARWLTGVAPAAVKQFIEAEYQYRQIRLGEGGDWALYEKLLRKAVETAGRLPDVQFVLVGEILVDVAPLRALPNVHLLGRKPYADLPAYAAAFDAAFSSKD